MSAIVVGVSGQDGFYMAELLGRQGIPVVALTTDLARAAAEFEGRDFPVPAIRAFDYNRIGAIEEVIEEVQPELIFNFAAKTAGSGMFSEPFEMSRLNGTFPIDILEAIRRSPRARKISFCQASSSEMFGNVTEPQQNENTPLRPKSPYGAAKAYAHNMVGVYRAAYGLRCCSAILYNHESERRSTNFVTGKIANGVAAIKLGLEVELKLGTLDVSRDWGYAPEYVEAMCFMATAAVPADYVLATGKLTSLRDLLAMAFSHVGLDYQAHIRVDDANKRATESVNLHGDPSKIQKELGWSAKTSIDQIIGKMVDYEIAKLSTFRSSRHSAISTAAERHN